MSLELVHTSVERGVRGDSGFAIAVVTRGLSASLEPVLAELSAYDFDRNRAVGADRIDWAHRIVSVSGRSHTVLSRTAPCGNDWSGRPNRVAHHIVVDPAERAAAGPAWMLANFRGFCDAVPAVATRDAGPELPRGDDAPRPATAWQAAGFDPGWAGVVAQTLLDAPSSVCCVVLPDEVDGLPLVLDVLALLPADKRWLVTFSTRFQRLPAGGRCQLRLLRAGASGVRAMLAEPGVRAIEVARGVAAGDSAAARAARLGTPVEPTVREAPSLRVNPVLHAASVLNDPADDRPRAGGAGSSAPAWSPGWSSAGSPAATAASAPIEVARDPSPAVTAVPPLPTPRTDAAAAAAQRQRVLVFVLFAYSVLALAIAAVLFLS